MANGHSEIDKWITDHDGSGMTEKQEGGVITPDNSMVNYKAGGKIKEARQEKRRKIKEVRQQKRRRTKELRSDVKKLRKKDPEYMAKIERVAAQEGLRKPSTMSKKEHKKSTREFKKHFKKFIKKSFKTKVKAARSEKKAARTKKKVSKSYLKVNKLPGEVEA